VLRHSQRLLLDKVRESDAMKRKARILVVDDEDRNLQLMRDILLLQEDYKWYWPVTGRALERVEEDPPDVILLDVNMPRRMASKCH